MYFHHTQNQNSTSSAAGKHHDGPGPSGLGGWGRHTFTPSMPLPSPGGYPNGNGGGGFGPPPGHHGHPHHPSFGGGGLHLGSQNSGAMGIGHGQNGGFGMGIFGGGSPPRNGADSQMPLTPLWQQQVIKAEACRQNSAPHHRARSAAVNSRSANKAAITISDPNRPVSSASNVNGAHKKNLSVVSTTDRSVTPDFAGDAAKTTTSVGHADPTNPTQVPVPIKEDIPWEQWSGLDLGGIRIKNLSSAMFSFTHLTSLYINHNVLTSIPPAINNLRHLTLLDATGNELTSIPPELGVLWRLKELLLFDNHLTTLPAELGSLYKLEMLGIEGNPMDERYRKILAEEGTEALIHHLRDTCAPGPGPPERQWITIEPDISSPSEGPQESFTVLTYNILCDSYAPTSSYTYTPKWALDWSYRKQTLLNEIATASADVVCLQEIDGAVYKEFFYPQLQAVGYDGCHYSRTRGRHMGSKDSDMVDGCATFWKKDKFSLVETQVIDFNRIALSNEKIRSDDMLNRVAMRDNIAVIALLEFIETGARLMAVNSHIFWDHHYRDVKIVQIGILMEELERVAEQFARYPPKPVAETAFNQGRPAPKYNPSLQGTDIPLILCVDLNSLVDSSVYNYISKGEIAPDHEDFMTYTYGDITRRGLQHRLGLLSSAESFGELKLTNFTPTFTAAIDYIFYTPSALKVTSVLGDVDKAYLDKNVGFPNAHFPSDHIPVFAQFRVKGPIDSHRPQGGVQHGYHR